MEVKNKIIKTKLIDWKKLKSLQPENFKTTKPEIIEKLKKSLIKNGLSSSFVVWDEPPPLPKNPKSKLGDIYGLGRHKIICGDSTDEAVVNRLLNGDKTDMVFTDPPYGIGYEYNDYNDIKGKEYFDFCDKWFPIIKKHSKFIFLTAGWKNNIYWLKHEPEDIFYWISRNKQTGGKFSHFRKIEPIFLWGNVPKKFRYSLDYFDANSDRLDGLRDLHTCPKPVSFIAEAIKPYKTILDIFLGSGTTVISSEQTDRTCYGIEIDPHYIDVIVQRWVNFTGTEEVIKNGKPIKWPVSK